MSRRLTPAQVEQEIARVEAIQDDLDRQFAEANAAYDARCRKAGPLCYFVPDSTVPNFAAELRWVAVVLSDLRVQLHGGVHS